jgi:hypothetical protein
MAIEDFTSQLQVLQDQLESHGDADLQLSETAKRDYIDAIEDFRTELKSKRDMAASSRFGDGFLVGGYSSVDSVQVGGFPSAQETARLLHRNVVGADGICAKLDKYIEYLDEFEETVSACFSRMQAEDQSI